MRLRRTNPGQPGYTRRRRGSGWSYLDSDGGTITAQDVRERIEQLAIPPAWQDVWITPHENGHLQAVGVDAAGRRQYLYHPQWQASRSKVKYVRALDLGRALPQARAAVTQDLSGSTLSRDRVLATAFVMLDRGHFRIGNAAYTQRYGSYGLSTLLRSHVRRDHGALVFDYVAKSGVQQTERIADEPLVSAVDALLRRRGGADLSELLVYRDGRTWRRIGNSDINEYLARVLRFEVTAKDFRTWHGSVLGGSAAALEFDRHPADRRWTNRTQDRAIRRVVVAVAANLGNTPAVCRASYVHPGVLDRFRAGRTVLPAVTRAMRAETIAATDPDGPELDPVLVNTLAAAPTVERAVLRLLKD